MFFFNSNGKKLCYNNVYDLIKDTNDRQSFTKIHNNI